VGQTFTLGVFSYTVTGVEAVREISGALLSETAGPGAAFVVVRYEIINNSKETATALADDFEIVDGKDRHFRRSSQATTTYAMSGGDKDLFATELHPGVHRPSVQIFEVPEEELIAGVVLPVPEKGLLGGGEVRVALPRLADPKVKKPKGGR
jgi:hypothetical protein